MKYKKWYRGFVFTFINLHGYIYASFSHSSTASLTHSLFLTIVCLKKEKKRKEHWGGKDYNRMGSQRPFGNSIPIYLHSQVNISNPCFDSLFSNFWHIYSTNFIWVSHNQTYFFFFYRSTGPEDVYVKVICSGICHTDIHLIKNDFGKSNYPMVPGYTLKYTPTCFFPLFKVMSDE